MHTIPTNQYYRMLDENSQSLDQFQSATLVRTYFSSSSTGRVLDRAGMG